MTVHVMASPDCGEEIERDTVVCFVGRPWQPADDIEVVYHAATAIVGCGYVCEACGEYCGHLWQGAA